MRKLLRFLQVFIKPRKFSLLNFCSSESSDMYEGGDGKNCKTFPCIPDKPSKLRNFSPLKLLSFMVVGLAVNCYLGLCYYAVNQNFILIFTYYAFQHSHCACIMFLRLTSSKLKRQWLCMIVLLESIGLHAVLVLHCSLHFYSDCCIDNYQLNSWLALPKQAV